MHNSTGAGTLAGSYDSRALSDRDIQLELDKIFQTLQLLKERGAAGGPGSSMDSANNPQSNRIGKHMTWVLLDNKKSKHFCHCSMAPPTRKPSVEDSRES